MNILDIVFNGMSILDIFIVLWVSAWGTWFFYKTNYDSPESGDNNDDFAKDKLDKYLKQAQHNLMIFDDGNNHENFNSIYNDPDIIDKLRTKLRENTSFQLKLHFNFKEKLDVNTLNDEFSDRVSIKYNQSNTRQNNEWHFKLFDDGAVCYASCHEVNATSRTFAIYEKNRYRIYHPDVATYKKTFKQQAQAFI